MRPDRSLTHTATPPPRGGTAAQHVSGWCGEQAGRAGDLSATLRRIERAAGALATASVARMDDVLPWFRGLPADQRVVGHAGRPGRRAVVGASGSRGRRHADGTHEVSDEIFDAAPRTLARSISLQQTVAADQGHHRRGRGAGAAAWPRRARSSGCATRCCASPARSRSAPPGSTPGRPSRAAPGTPGCRRCWSTRCCAATRPTCWPAGRPRWAGPTRRRWRWRSAARPAARRPPCCTPCTGWPGGSASR